MSARPCRTRISPSISARGRNSCAATDAVQICREARTELNCSVLASFECSALSENPAINRGHDAAFVMGGSQRRGGRERAFGVAGGQTAGKARSRENGNYGLGLPIVSGVMKNYGCAARMHCRRWRQICAIWQNAVAQNHDAPRIGDHARRGEASWVADNAGPEEVRPRAQAWDCQNGAHQRTFRNKSTRGGGARSAKQPALCN